ncbi:hypothetical protein D3C71_1906730 [compost metagenome]
MMVWNGRLPGPTRLARLGPSGSALKPKPRFCRLMPKLGSTTPEPKPAKLLWMKLTIMPLSSTAVR